MDFWSNLDQIGTWGIALGGWLVAIVQMRIARKQQSKQREDQLFQITLSYFDGNAQTRSLGIALVEGIWIKRMDYTAIFVPVLINQVIYLLNESIKINRNCELRNVIRIFQALEQMVLVTNSSSTCRYDLLDAIGKAYSEEGVESDSCLLSRETLKLWYKKFGGSDEELEIHYS